MKKHKQLFQFLIYSNLLIASAAVAQCFLTYLILSEEVNYAILAVEGCSTLLLYNFSAYLSLPRSKKANPHRRVSWLEEHIQLFWMLSVSMLLLLISVFFHIHWYSLLFLFFIGALSLSYAVPLFVAGGRKVGLRQVPGLKVFHIALIWSLSGVGLPVVELWASGIQIDWCAANYLGVTKIVFILLCTLPFDIRDINQDRYYGLKTIPVMLGAKNSQIVCYSLLFAHTLILTFAPYSWSAKIGLLFTNCIALLFFRFCFSNAHKNYDDVYLFDFLLVIQCVLVWLTGYWFFLL